MPPINCEISMFTSLRRLVAPPFLYGTRHPLVSGLIRYNEEMSIASKEVLSRLRNAPACKGDEIVGFEIVSDDSVSKAHDKTHIEAGAGIVLKTEIRIPSASNLPCAIVMNFASVGVKNNFSSFHSSQARIYAEQIGEEYLCNRGVVITQYTNGEERQVTEGFADVNTVLRVTLRNDEPSVKDVKMERITAEERNEMMSQYVSFPTRERESFILTNGAGDVLCGLSCSGANANFSDPFVTLDCPEGLERKSIEFLAQQIIREKNLSGKPTLRFAESDGVIANLFKEGKLVSVLTALPVGLSVTEQQSLVRAPWAISDLFV